MKKEHNVVKALRLSAAVLLAFAFCIIFTKAGSNTRAYAAGRLSVSDSRLWINGEGKLTVTLLNRATDEDITVSLKNKKYADVVKSNWDKDSCTLTVTPLKNKNTTLTVSAGSESIKVKLYMLCGNKLSGEDVYSLAKAAMVEIKTLDSEDSVYIGSGFFIGNGLVITNHHVVEAASKITITDYFGKTYAIKEIVGYSAEKDLIVFRVKGSNSGALTFADTVLGGEKIYCIGSPAGLTGSFITGVVANEGYSIDGVYYNQLSLPTGVGMGGGPIINSKGRVLGIMTLYVKDAQNIAMAVDCREITAYLDSLKDADRMTLKDFYKTTKGKTKESNDYQIFNGFSDESTVPTSRKTSSALTAEEVFALAKAAAVDIVVIYNEKGSMATGSGFFIDKNTIVTNDHVVHVEKIYRLLISDYYGNTYTMKSMKTDSEYDVAVLTVALEEAFIDEKTGKSTPHGVLEMAKGYIPAVGEEVYGMGSPAGYSCTFSEGIVSMSERFLDDIAFISHSVPITGGSSGGPLLNRYGQVIGINSRFININSLSNSNLSVLIEYIDKAK